MSSKTGVIITLAVAGVLVLGGFSSYNSMVNDDENVNQTYSQVQTSMQRMADLLPNLVQVVKGYASHEKDTLEGVAAARSGLTAVAKLNPADLAKNPELQKQLIEAQTNMASAMVKVSVLGERYPDLKAAPLFQNLMVETTGSVNRIADARRKNQLAINEYNKSVRSVPRIIYANALGFGPKPYFEAKSQDVPQISFDKPKG